MSCFPLAGHGVGREQEQSSSLETAPPPSPGEHAPYFEGLSQNGVEKGRGAPVAQTGQLVPVSQPLQRSARDRVCLLLCSGSGPQQPADCLPTLTFAVVCQTLMFIVFQSKYLPPKV